MDSHDIQLFLHIVLAIFALGMTFVAPFLGAFAERKGVAATRFAHEFTLFLDKWVLIPGIGLVGLLGVGLIFSEDEFTEEMPAWLWVSIVWYLVAYGVSIFYQRRNVKSALATLEGIDDSAELPDSYGAATRPVQVVGTLLLLSIIGITFLMVVQP